MRAQPKNGAMIMLEEILAEPVELTDQDLDEVAGGFGFNVNIGNWVSQSNGSFNQTSTGNNNNGVSGNQFFF
jgi:hypothetical protein